MCRGIWYIHILSYIFRCIENITRRICQITDICGWFWGFDVSKIVYNDDGWLLKSYSRSKSYGQKVWVCSCVFPSLVSATRLTTWKLTWNGSTDCATSWLRRSAWCVDPELAWPKLAGAGEEPPWGVTRRPWWAHLSPSPEPAWAPSGIPGVTWLLPVETFPSE